MIEPNQGNSQLKLWKFFLDFNKQYSLYSNNIFMFLYLQS